VDQVMIKSSAQAQMGGLEGALTRSVRGRNNISFNPLGLKDLRRTLLLTRRTRRTGEFVKGDVHY